MSAVEVWQGSCLCAAVHYEIDTRIDGAIVGINYCHCSRCQKASGTAFATSMGVLADAFAIVSGERTLHYYQSSPGKRRYFCGRCGSPLYSRAESSRDRVYVRLGTLDGYQRNGAWVKPELTPQVHIHVAEKAGWYTILDELPQLERDEGLDF